MEVLFFQMEILFFRRQQRAKKDTKTKEVLEQIFKNKVDKYENLLTQSLNTNKDLQDFIDSLAKEDLIDSRAKFKL